MHGQIRFVLCTFFLYLIYDHVALCGCPKMRTKTMAINTLAHSSRAHLLQSGCFWTRENPCSGLCLISMENWMIQTESASPIWRHLKGDLLWSPTPRGLPEVQADEQPFQKTCYLIFFLGPMCQFPVKLKALRGGGTPSRPACWQPGTTAATWCICATEHNYEMNKQMINAKNTVIQRAHCFQGFLVSTLNDNGQMVREHWQLHIRQVKAWAHR